MAERKERGDRTERLYTKLGSQRKKDGIPVEDLVSSLSLLKKHIWMFTYSFGVWEKAVDIYRMFELGNDSSISLIRPHTIQLWGITQA